MPPVGKELEPQLTPDQLANIEVAGYVEKIEKQTENIQPTNQSIPQAQVVPPTKPTDMGKIVAAQFATSSRPKIVLPMDQRQVEEGLHRRVFDGVRWLSEWCVFMIKKYPGRVFYLPPTNGQ